MNLFRRNRTKKTDPALDEPTMASRLCFYKHEEGITCPFPAETSCLVSTDDYIGFVDLCRIDLDWAISGNASINGKPVTVDTVIELHPDEMAW